MTISIPKNKEQVIDFLIQHISLGTYDKRFVVNISNNSKLLTSNQSDLLDKIILRYQKQISKKTLDANQLIRLPWKISPVISSPQFTEVHLSIENEYIVLRSPYNKTFITEIRRKQLLLLNWKHEDKCWTLPATHTNLKSIIESVKQHYSEPINYCPVIKEFLQQLEEFNETDAWSPTLTRINGTLYVIACNESLHTVMQDIELNTDIHTIARLIRMGIVLSPALMFELSTTHDVDISELFAHITDVEITDIDKLVKYLTLLKPDVVIVSEWHNSIYNQLYTDITKTLYEHNFNTKVILTTKKYEIYTEEMQQYQLPVKIEFNRFTSDYSDYTISKKFLMVNSTPIKVN